ncbi:class I SAM-dependent methyltransferase [Sphingobium limneticum]|jgi:NADH dehydrogenase [ubiquinone] 1 alpha subcomplex assembly factor 5|uniref:Methyltransferase domain-containing protein n=1 Tax=Sphingobium limneticum TaxID=1007511 RepID=A0A5J5I3T2_9SPHN|nr:class I SAM-dependent methyltransferase [Sphingobium limneticum]KAA9016839.1 methyltransferase domain-containing protein [Sphingobium limneticum]KAA9029818.1 methyltransferase domain-containing protein [Sphingobium limneticum]
MDSRPDIFDRARRARHRDRMLPAFADHDFLYRAMLDELLDRLEDVQRDLPEVLLIGCPDGSAKAALEAMGKRVACADPGFLAAKSLGGVQADEDALPFADDSFDLVIACGTLDSVNDLPGALILMRRVLRPDGLMLAAFAGAGSLSRLKAALLAAEGDRPGQHVHPQVDVRSAGDLLSRAGFAMPVADGDVLNIRYGDVVRLMHDLRGMGAGNALETRAPALTRDVLMRAAGHFAGAADPDGRTAEQMAIVYLSGWKPDPSQAAPAKRGSATVSLAAALKGKG